MGAIDDLEVIASESRRGVTSSQVAEVLSSFPDLRAEVQRIAKLPPNTDPNPYEVGTALRKLAETEPRVAFMRGGHGKVNKWSVVPAAPSDPYAGRQGRVSDVGSSASVRDDCRDVQRLDDDTPNYAMTDALFQAIRPDMHRVPTPINDTIPTKQKHCGPGIHNARPASKLEELIRHTRKHPVPLADLCDLLDLPPSKTRKLVEEAQRNGFHVAVAGDAIGWKEPEPNLDGLIDIGVAPTVGERQTIAVISDTHFGSRYCLRPYIKDFIEYAYSRGVRYVFHAGDMLDGCYDHGRWELSHHGFDEQCQDAIETLPRIRGMQYLFASGNHDETFTKSTGMDTGRAIVDRFRSVGRDDIVYLGPRGAMVRFGGAKIELWHPRQTSAAYSLSYRLQNKIRDTSIGRKSDLLFAGHWHTWCYFEQRGVHALACGTFQGAGSAFSKSLGGAPSIGGTVVSWETTEHGTLRRVSVERSAYYEHEQPREILPSVG